MDKFRYTIWVILVSFRFPKKLFTITKLGSHHQGHALLGEQVVVHHGHTTRAPEWKDWHNYTLLELEAKRAGPGEHGEAVHLLEGESEHAAYAENGFNIKVSDRVSLDRSLKVVPIF